MSRLHPAISLDDVSGDEDAPRRRRRKQRPMTKLERRLEFERRWRAEERARRERRQARREREAEREPTLEPLTGAIPRASDPWGPAVRMGANLRVQAAVGHRAAVIELKPGLFLVAEVPEAALRPEFGFVPLLAPMILKAATSTITPIVQAVQAGKERRQARQAQQHPAQPAPLALPGPVAAPSPATAGLPWADEALVGEIVGDVVGCSSCGGRCGR